jgi:hypothetical protein
VDLFNELKLKHTMKYIIYNMDDDMKKIQVRLPFWHFFFVARQEI